MYGYINANNRIFKKKSQSRKYNFAETFSLHRNFVSVYSHRDTIFTHTKWWPAQLTITIPNIDLSCFINPRTMWTYWKLGENFRCNHKANSCLYVLLFIQFFFSSFVLSFKALYLHILIHHRTIIAIILEFLFGKTSLPSI